MNARAAVQEILDLYSVRGDDEYFGERVTQSQHALQAAALAEQAGADEEAVIAALLHDIGHLLNAAPHAHLGHAGHARSAAPWLRERGFGERCISLVAGHVDAKRYLVAADAGYAARLSEASVQTLALQGGPMSAAEAEAFSRHPLFAEMLRLRTWDEQAKDPAARVPGFDGYAGMIERYLSTRPA